jgi:hypothetical protein
LTDNQLLQKYLKDEWLSCEERWAEHARQGYHGAIDTTNQQESMNRMWKEKWLNGRIDTRLDSLLKVYRLEIVQHYWMEYVQHNVKSIRWGCMGLPRCCAFQVACHSGRRSRAHAAACRYGATQRQDPLPAWAVGLPKPVSKGLQQRHKHATAMAAAGVAPVQTPGGYEVAVSEETLRAADEAATRDGRELVVPQPYAVCISSGTCTCRDHIRHRHVCKHTLLGLMHIGLDIKPLPSILTAQPHLVLDMDAIGLDPS